MSKLLQQHDSIESLQELIGTDTQVTTNVGSNELEMTSKNMTWVGKHSVIKIHIFIFV